MLPLVPYYTKIKIKTKFSHIMLIIAISCNNCLGIAASKVVPSILMNISHRYHKIAMAISTMLVCLRVNQFVVYVTAVKRMKS